MKRESRRPFGRIAIATFFCAMLLGAAPAFADELTSAPNDGGNANMPMACETIDATADDTSNADVQKADSGTQDAKSDAQATEVYGPIYADAPAHVDAPDPIGIEGEPVDDPLVAEGTIETIEMFRLYNSNSGEHFYTGDWQERASLVDLGWQFEGIGWVAPDYSKNPVFRLYNPNAGDHHYTLDADERDRLIDEGWNDEGIGWYSDDSERVAVLRQYNPNAATGSHNFTTSEDEDVALGENGWECEGIAWYAISEGDNSFALSYIYLDAGHGMGSSVKGVYDSGACGSGYEEAKLTAELVELTAQYATQLYGLKVYSNVGDNVEYFNRQDDALERGCTSLVSIHFNASEGGATGSESYIHSRNAAAGAAQLQSIMHEHLVAATELRDRGKKSAALAVCSGKGTNIPGTLLEICFIDNSYDMKQYQSRKDAIARELAAGLYEAAKSGF